MKQKAIAFDKHFDAREVASYGVMEAAHYLRIPRTTIRDWVSGRHYRSITGVRFSKPIIQVPDPDMKLLSFMNLVEIHVLDAIRRKHDIPLEKVIERAHSDRARSASKKGTWPPFPLSQNFPRYLSRDGA